MVRRGRAARLSSLVVAAAALTLGGTALGTPPSTSRAIAAFFPSLAPSAGPALPAAKPKAAARPASLDAPMTMRPAPPPTVAPAAAIALAAPRPEPRHAAPALLGAAACGKHFIVPFDGPLAFRGAYRGSGPTQFCPQRSGFGHVRGGRNHWGVDISSPTGTSVRAAVDGTVLYAREANGYGLHARLRFSAPIKGKGGGCGGSEEYEIIYAHLTDDGKTPTGTRSVRAGEVIGRVGCTGNARGMCSPSPESHLHVTVQKVHTKVKADPAPFLGWHIGVPAEHPADWINCGRR